MSKVLNNSKNRKERIYTYSWHELEQQQFHVGNNSNSEAVEEKQKIVTEAEGIVQELFEKAQKKALSIVENAENEASALIEKAKKQAEKMQFLAHEEGYQEGYKVGTEKTHQELAKLQENIVLEINKTQQCREKMYHAAEDSLVSLAIEIAQKVVMEELKTNPEVIKSIAQAAVKKLADSEKVYLTVHSLDYEYILDLINENGSNDQIILEIDNSLSPGDILVHDGCTYIDGKVETQFNVISEELEDKPLSV